MGKVLQVVDDDGNYQQDAVEAFVREQDLDSAGVNYQIVAIMGPQSSGKSTLMNAVVSPFLPPFIHLSEVLISFNIVAHFGWSCVLSRC